MRTPSGVPGHGQQLGLEHLVVIPAGLLQDLGKLAQQLLNFLPARERCRGTQLTGDAGHSQDQELRVQSLLQNSSGSYLASKYSGLLWVRDTIC